MGKEKSCDINESHSAFYFVRFFATLVPKKEEARDEEGNTLEINKMTDAEGKSDYASQNSMAFSGHGVYRIEHKGQNGIKHSMISFSFDVFFSALFLYASDVLCTAGYSFVPNSGRDWWARDGERMNSKVTIEVRLVMVPARPGLGYTYTCVYHTYRGRTSVGRDETHGTSAKAVLFDSVGKRGEGLWRRV